MERKIASIVVVMLLILTTIPLISMNEPIIRADSDGNNTTGTEFLDFRFMKNYTTYLANICNSSYNNTELRKGRFFGSKGEKAAEASINETFTKICGFNIGDVKEIQLLPVNGSRYNYTELAEVTSTKLTIDNSDILNQYPKIHNQTIPLNDFYPIASVREPNGGRNNLTMNSTFNHIRVINYIKFLQDYPKYNTGMNPYNLSYSILNNYTNIMGNLTYVQPSTTLPSHGYSTLFLFDETTGVEKQINNATDAAGVLLIHNTSKSTHYFLDATKYVIPIARINDNSTTNSIVTNIKNLLASGTIVIADNTIYENKTTFIYNLSSPLCFPSYDFAVVCNLSLGVSPCISLFIDTLFCRNLWKHKVGGSICKGFIVNDDTTAECHQALAQSIHGYRMIAVFYALPGFSVNNTIGGFLWKNSGLPNNTISGYIDQTHYKETADKPGVTAFDIAANISLLHSPDNKRVILSSRYDSMWSECCGDSGAGNAIII